MVMEVNERTLTHDEMKSGMVRTSPVSLPMRTFRGAFPRAIPEVQLRSRIERIDFCANSVIDRRIPQQVPHRICLTSVVSRMEKHVLQSDSPTSKTLHFFRSSRQ